MLVNSDPPRGSVDVLSAELTAAALDGRLNYYLDQPVRLETLSATAPHPFAVVDAAAILDDVDAPLVVRGSGWRYLLEVNHRPVALATTVTDAEGNHRYGGIGTGPAVSVVVYAIHVADELLKNTTDEFRIAAVDIPAVHSVLLQAADTDGSQTAYLPIGLATSLHPARFYSRAQIRDELRGMLTRLRAEPSSGEPVGG
jgi:hypothetical protein